MRNFLDKIRFFSLSLWWNKQVEKKRDKGILIAASAVIGILFIWLAASLYLIKSDKVYVTLGRSYNDFVITDVSSMNPFVFSVKDEVSGKVIDGVQTPNGQKCDLKVKRNLVGERHKFLLFTVVSSKNENDIKYIAVGAKDVICDGVEFNQNVSNNNYIE